MVILFLHRQTNNRFIIMMKSIIYLFILILMVAAAPDADLMRKIPGYSSDYNTSIYSGYLDTGNINRSIHYAFVQSVKGRSNSDPVTLWLNGGPGCSSLLGFLLEVGPYYLKDGVDYMPGDNLTLNEYSWHKASNILFFQSPAGVGYSYNLDKSYKNNDSNTASDSLNALVDFFKKFPQYKQNRFFIAGQSYAGKYIPDLAVLIDKYNLGQPQNKINLKAMMIGNGVMSFETLEQSTIEYIIKKGMVDPEIIPLYEKFCLKDFESDECSTFLDKYDKDTDGLNPYDIYGYCYYNDSFGLNKKPLLSQQAVLNRIKSKFAKKPNLKFTGVEGLQGPPCGYLDGVYNYFNIHDSDYHAKFEYQRWNGPCAQNITYNIDPAGSIDSYTYLLKSRKYEIILYNGNADAVVPYIDTYKGFQKLQLLKTSDYLPWFTEDQHSGFQIQYTGILFVVFKGASHQVPQSRRPQAFNFFKNIVNNIRDKPNQLTIEQQ